jgi:hypothetical protein
MSTKQPAKTILILSANPIGTAPLRLDKEVREIKAGLQRSKYRRRFVGNFSNTAGKDRSQGLRKETKSGLTEI